ncbi:MULTISPECIES: hypothetical protein [Clostridium]
MINTSRLRQLNNQLYKLTEKYLVIMGSIANEIIKSKKVEAK